MPIITESLAEGKSVRFYPHGTSMLPMLRQDIDSVVLSPINGKLKKFDVPLYQRENGKYILHRIIDVGSTYTCMGDNQFRPETGIRHSQMIAVITSFTRKDREIAVTALSYRIYCRLWHYTRPVRHFFYRLKGWLRRHIL